MQTLNLIRVQIFACATIALSNLTPTFASQVYLEDADPAKPNINNPNMPSLEQHEWPRVMMAETQSLTGPAEQYSKYQILATQAGVIRKVAGLQQSYPNLMYFRMFNPYEYLGFNLEDEGEVCPQGNGIPFTSTGPATQGCSVFAGHWLYRAGTRTTAFINTTATTVSVQNAAIFNVGEYAVIYNSPAGSFNNAEHIRVTGKNNSNNTLRVQRAYKSAARSHSNGSIVAPHVTGQSRSDDTRNWVFNLSNQAPRDANGRRTATVIPLWLRDNITRDHRGGLTNVNVSGILFDSDNVFLSPNAQADANNDLVTDDGLSPSGVNWYGQGMNTLYTNIRNQFPNLIISGGTRDSGGFASLNGVQMEGFPNNSDFHTANPVYDRLGGLLAKYTYQSRHKDNGPAHTHVLSKTPSRLYPFAATTRPNSNRAFRFALGMTMLEDGYFAFRNTREYPDVWFDEYAVDVTPGSASYGNAIASNQNDETQIRAHTGWLGQPTGVRTRIYNDSDFRPGLSLLQNGTFESNNDLLQWRGREVTLSTTNTPRDVQDGSGALRVSGHSSYQAQFFEAAVIGPSTNLVAGRRYTFVFSAKASTRREISASVGGHSERFLLAPEWQRFVITFTASSSGSFRTNFNVGRESSTVWLDTIHLLPGDANVFRRDFDNGIVVVNATPSRRTIDLGGRFQRINGNQDQVNNGASLTSVTLPPYDTALLVRPNSGNSGGGSTSDTQAPNVQITSPTTVSNSPINNTTIAVTDNVAINANAVSLRSDNTAGVRNFNCTQTNTRRVDCTLTISSSGDLRIVARDRASNATIGTQRGYRINSTNGTDTTRPDFRIQTPTLVSIGPIQDTRIIVEDDTAIQADAVMLRRFSTALVSNFRCSQISTNRVDCRLNILSSGNLQLVATDEAGNIRYKNVSGFSITADTSAPTFQISAPTKRSNDTIRDMTIIVRDNGGIRSDGVAVLSSSSAGWANFRCVEISRRRVDCSIAITRSGDIALRARDLSGNQRSRTEAGFVIRKVNAALAATMLLLNDK